MLAAAEGAVVVLLRQKSEVNRGSLSVLVGFFSRGRSEASPSCQLAA